MYKTMYQKYQIDNGKLDCEYGYKSPLEYDFPKQQKYWQDKCQSIPLHSWKKPRYNHYAKQIRENYTASVANITTGEKGGNTCAFYECQPKSKSNLGIVKQMIPYYNIGVHINISDPAKFIYAMPNQKLIGDDNYCFQYLKQTPWYGSYNAQ